MNPQESIQNAAETLFGKMQVEFFRRLLLASESKNSVADTFRAALVSKYKSETERLSGRVLTKMERQGVNPKKRAEICKHLGIGGSREGDESYFDTLVAEPSDTKVQPAGKPNGS